MPVVAIDRTRGTRKMFTCDNELAEEITAWRTAQRPIPTESVAITELLWQALIRWREQQESEEQSKGRRS
jgi:hypothetical protein